MYSDSISTCIKFLAFLSPLCTNSSFAQHIHADLFEESLNLKVQVSGVTRVGLTYGATIKPRSLDTIYVWHETNSAGKRLCLNVTSRDGSYKAKMQYTLPNSLVSPLKLDFPSKYKSTLFKYSSPYLAIMANKAESCDTKLQSIIPASWHLERFNYSLDLLVNTGELVPYIEIPGKDDEKIKISCDKIKKKPVTSFNYVCEIPTNLNLLYKKAMIFRSDVFGNPAGGILLPLGLK